MLSLCWLFGCCLVFFHYLLALCFFLPKKVGLAVFWFCFLPFSQEGNLSCFPPRKSLIWGYVLIIFWGSSCCYRCYCGCCCLCICFSFSGPRFQLLLLVGFFFCFSFVFLLIVSIILLLLTCLGFCFLIIVLFCWFFRFLFSLSYSCFFLVSFILLTFL